MVFIVTCSVAEIKAAFASAYRTGSIRRFHFKLFTPNIGCVNSRLTGTDINCCLLYTSGFIHAARPVTFRAYRIENEWFKKGKRVIDLEVYFQQQDKRLFVERIRKADVYKRQSLIRCSLPSCIRIVAICAIEPIAFANPLRAANVPVIIVVATAPPTPTTSTPKRPVAGLMFSFIAIE